MDGAGNPDVPPAGGGTGFSRINGNSGAVGVEKTPVPGGFSAVLAFSVAEVVSNLKKPSSSRAT
jgi:hypothetical protein